MIKIRIVAFEGLGGMAAGYLQKGLLDPLKKKHDFLEIQRHSHATKNLALPLSDYLIVVGHSLGGERALDFGVRMKANAIVTLDPRRNNPLSFLDFLIPFQAKFPAPGKIECHNFYRHGFMPGYQVEGAQNHKLSGTSHTGLPYHGMVFSVMEDLIETALALDTLK